MMLSKEGELQGIYSMYACVCVFKEMNLQSPRDLETVLFAQN